MHMDTNLGCQPPMSSNGVDVPVEESVGDGDDEMQKKTPYCNFFPKSCYQNVQFKQTKGGHIEAHLVSDVAMSTDKTVEDEEVNTLSPQPINSPPSANQSTTTTTTTTAAAAAAATTTTTTTTTTAATVATASTSSIASTINTDVTSRTSSVTSTSALSSFSVPVAEAATSKTTSAEFPPRASSELAGQVVPSTANSNTCQSAVTTSSVSTSDNTDGPISTSDNPILTNDSNTKVNSAIIEVGDINPVYQSWQILKKKNDSKPVPIVTTNNYETANFTTPKSTSAYDLMEPILKPSTCNSSVFLSAPSSVIDNQISDGAQPDAPMVYENVVPIGNGKFTVTPPSSCDSKENLDFPLESSPNEQQTSLNRSNSTGSMLPRPTVQHQATFYSPANNRKEILKHSASLSASPQVATLQESNEISKSMSLSETDTNNSKINVRGSTAISRGSVKKKITLFESSTLPAGSKSLAELGIFEDQDSDNGFIV